MHSPLHHLHIRRRVRLIRDPYPHHIPAIRLLDSLVLFAGILGPLMTLPQIWEIYVMQNASGVSVSTWGMMSFFNCIWLAYGIVHKSKLLTITYILWLIVNTTITIGALIYG
jgi:uncharacterized protein with PQ loop repeat